MKTIIQLLAILTLALSALGVSALAALAVPPSNDTFAGATPVVVGYSEVLDTTEATTDSDDAQLNESCGAPATDASVWYALDGSDTMVVVDVSQSGYPAGVLVGVGSQGNLQTVACGPGTVAFFAEAGTTYYVLAIDDQSDGGGNGGLLSISFNEVQTPTVDITVNRFGVVNAHTGVATISGTYTCTNGDFIEVFGDARQNVGRLFTIVGSFDFFDSDTCDEAPHSWSADVFPQSGKFAGGKMMTVTFAFSCGPFECAEGFVEQTVQLRGARK
jgi:hypothetical protein